MEISKFSFAEMLSNSSNGKTSDAKTTGTYLVFVGSIFMGYGVFFVKDLSLLNPILLQGLAVISLGVALIGGKIIKPTK